MRLDDPHRTAGANSGSWNRSQGAAHASHSDTQRRLDRYRALAWILPTGIALSSVSIWLVPPYLALMCLLLYWPEWRAEAKAKARRASSADAGALALTGRSHATAGSASIERGSASNGREHLANPHVHLQTNVGSVIGGDGVAIVEVESAGSSDETPAKAKKGRGRGRPRTKRPPPEIDVDRFDTSAWVQVKPGKFVRIEEAGSDAAPFLAPGPNQTSESNESIDISALKNSDEFDPPVTVEAEADAPPDFALDQSNDAIDDQDELRSYEQSFVESIGMPIAETVAEFDAIRSEEEPLGDTIGDSIAATVEEIDAVRSEEERIVDAIGDSVAETVESESSERDRLDRQEYQNTNEYLDTFEEIGSETDDQSFSQVEGEVHDVMEPLAEALGDSVDPSEAEAIDTSDVAGVDRAGETPISSNETPFDALLNDDCAISVSEEFEPVLERSMDAVRRPVADQGRPTADDRRNTNDEAESIADATEIACEVSEVSSTVVVIEDPLDSEFQAVDDTSDLGDEVDASHGEELRIEPARDDNAEFEDAQTVEDAIDVARDVSVAESAENAYSNEEPEPVEPRELERCTADDRHETTEIDVKTVEDSQESSSIYDAIEASLVEESAGVVNDDRARHRALHLTNVHRDRCDRRRCAGNRAGSRRRVALRSRSVVGRPFGSPRRLARPYVSRAPP